MKSVLISIQPKWCEKICSGEKIIEVRKTRPKLETPFKCYIYCTKEYGYSDGEKLAISHYLENGIWFDTGKVIGEFVCDEIFHIRVFENGTIQYYNCHAMERSCVPYDDIVNYIGNGCCGYGWHISDLKIYDKPKELSEFSHLCENDNKCVDCKYWVHENNESGITEFCGCDGLKPITRPPQSWCYVESLGE